jgi:hypothetical protein
MVLDHHVNGYLIPVNRTWGRSWEIIIGLLTVKLIAALRASAAVRIAHHPKGGRVTTPGPAIRHSGSTPPAEYAPAVQ